MIRVEINSGAIICKMCKHNGLAEAMIDFIGRRGRGGNRTVTLVDLPPQSYVGYGGLVWVYAMNTWKLYYTRRKKCFLNKWIILSLNLDNLGLDFHAKG